MLGVEVCVGAVLGSCVLVLVPLSGLHDPECAYVCVMGLPV